MSARQKKSKKQKSATLTIIGKVIGTLFLIAVITGCIVATVLSVYILDMIKSDDLIDISNIKLNYTSIIYAEDSSTGEYYEVERLHNQENRIWVDYDKIPEQVKNAFIAIEDKRFREHHGVDWKRTASAALNLFLPLYEGRPGGSTITQQLVKNITGDDENRIERKVQEIFRALNVEKHYSKDTILEAYLNTIHLGNNTNGVQTAANLYFNKDISEITIAEAASIAAITKYPILYDPFKNPEKNKDRQMQVLYEMNQQGLITDEEYEAAKVEPLVFNNTIVDDSEGSSMSYFTDNVIEEVIADLMEKYSCSYTYAENMLLRNGYRIYSTMDKNIQTILETKYKDSKTFPAVYNAEPPQSAMVICDTNGKVLGLVGGRGIKEYDRGFNRATQAKRQPGSSIKPLAVYGPAIEYDLIHWSSLIEDSAVETKADGNPWPVNYYGKYLGNITVDEAIQRSTNTVAVKLVMQLSPKTSFDFLYNKLSIKSLVTEKKIGNKVFSDIDRATMSLGSLTDGVTVLEMAGAYQIYANGGTFTKPYSYTKVEDANGNVILEHKETYNRVISEESATIVNKLMQRVVTGPYGTGKNAKLGNIPVAGKTGTSSEDLDQWFVGITPYYVGIVWFGYDTPQTIRYSTYPPPVIWKNVMSEVHSGLAAKDFSSSKNVVSHKYCKETGLLATDSCTNVEVGWYKESNVPAFCPGHSTSSSDISGSDSSGGIPFLDPNNFLTTP